MFFFARDHNEIEWVLRALSEQGLLDRDITSVAYGVQLTPDGWEHFAELTQKGPAQTNPAFVAMWYGDQETRAEMRAAYQEGIELGIKDAGYGATRVDLEQHNDYIMDKVLGDIRKAPFVVADSTGHRNGVYFEAGFARGLGVPVIHTCREDHFHKAHFDTAQLNHILWTTTEDLRERIRNRILGTIGQGPYTSE